MTTAQRDLNRRIQPDLFAADATVEGPLFPVMERRISASGNPVYTLAEAVHLVNHCEQAEWPGPLSVGDDDPEDDLIEDYEEED